MTTLLEVDDVSVRFGGLYALRDLSFSVEAGQLVSVIGPNGAGKTTLFNVIAGRFKPTRGDVRVAGSSVRQLGLREMNRLGVGRTFQIARPFRSLSVAENIRVALAAHRRAGPLGALAPRRRDSWAQQSLGELLELTGLAAVAGRSADALNIGGLRRLEIARALAGDPKLLLLDEPAAGIGADGFRPLAELIHTVKERGVTILLVEHYVGFALSLCEKVVVLDEGHKIAEGQPEVIRNDPGVIAAYLGTETAATKPAAPSS